jgi:putative flippase GtrA
MLQSLADGLLRLAPARYQRVARQFIKFGITGTIGAIVDFSTYNLLLRGLGFTAFYHVFGLQFAIANNISVFLAIISNFILNKYWTFRDPSKKIARQWLGFFVLNAFTWLLNQLLVAYFTFQVPLVALMFGSQKDNAAKALAIGIILFLNFFGSKFLIFRKAGSTPVRV